MINADKNDLSDADYAVLADFRHTLRAFLHFSESAAEMAGLTPQQHQALLAIRASAGRGMTVGELAERLLLRPHSATGLVDRLVQADLLARLPSREDRRRVSLALTERGESQLRSLSAAHRAELRRIRPLLTELLTRL